MIVACSGECVWTMELLSSPSPEALAQLQCFFCHSPVTDRTTDPLQGADAGTRLPEAQSLAGAPLDGAEGDSKPSR